MSKSLNLTLTDAMNGHIDYVLDWLVVTNKIRRSECSKAKAIREALRMAYEHAYKDNFVRERAAEKAAAAGNQTTDVEDIL